MKVGDLLKHAVTGDIAVVIRINAKLVQIVWIATLSHSYFTDHYQSAYFFKIS